MKLFNKIKEFFKKLFGKSSKKMKVVWCYGGFDGSKAVEDPKVKISGFTMNSKSMTMRWDSGMKAWGYQDSESKGIACVFFYDDKTKSWMGGKFEYISTSRTYREWTNMKTKYAGWDYAKFIGAKKHAFCVASEDAKKRTNFIFD